MALIVRNRMVYRDIGGKFYITVPSDYLSLTYTEIKEGGKIFGKIISAKDNRGVPIEGVENIEVSFEIKPGYVVDTLYFDEESFKKIRDFGIIMYCSVDVILEVIEVDGKKIEIFPKRNVEI